MRVKITKRGIYGADGEIPVGTEFTVGADLLPKGWAGKYEVISGDATGKTPVTNPAPPAPSADPERDALVAEAAELGLKHHPNLGVKKLKAMIAEAKAG